MSTTEIVPAQAQPVALMTVIERLSSNPNVDIDKLRQILELQERWEMNKAKAEFRDAMAEFKKHPPEIIRQRTAQMKGVAKGSGNEYSITIQYADLENVTTAIQDGLAGFGITHRFTIQQEPDRVTVSCVLSRGLYTDDPATLFAPHDTSGAKNPIQSIASTVSYLERYTLLAACGMAAGMPDTDGNTGGIPAEERTSRIKAIQTSPDVDALKKVYMAASKAATGAKDTEALEIFTKAKDTRYRELSHA